MPIVTVYVAACVKNMLSAAVGTDAPGAPPDVADQFAVLEVFQVPEPPTQYLSAMFTPLRQQEHPQPAALQPAALQPEAQE